MSARDLNGSSKNLFGKIMQLVARLTLKNLLDQVLTSFRLQKSQDMHYLKTIKTKNHDDREIKIN
jgi:hypothetical protein